jgi:hypothetical protein
LATQTVDTPTMATMDCMAAATTPNHNSAEPQPTPVGPLFSQIRAKQSEISSLTITAKDGLLTADCQIHAL